MVRRLGGQTVTLVTITEDTDRDRYNKPLKVRTETIITGCRFRPVDSSEDVELGEVTLERWRLTAPPIEAKAGDEIICDGIVYQVVGGARVYPDMAGRPFKVTIECERRLG